MYIRALLMSFALATAMSAPGISLADSAPATVTLRYRFQPGESVRYSLQDDSTMSSPAVSADMLPKTHAEFVYKMAVSSVRSDGRATVTYSQESSSLTLDGQTSPSPPGGTAASSLTCVMSPDGRVISSSLGSGSESGTSNGFSSLEQVSAAFPEAPARIGDTWSSVLSPGTSDGLTGTVQYKLLSIAVSGVKTLAKIGTSTDATFAQSADGIGFNGHVTAEGTLVFDITKGQIESSVETSHASLVPVSADMAGASFNVETQSSMERVAG